MEIVSFSVSCFFFVTINFRTKHNQVNQINLDKKKKILTFGSLVVSDTFWVLLLRHSLCLCCCCCCLRFYWCCHFCCWHSLLVVSYLLNELCFFCALLIIWKQLMLHINIYVYLYAPPALYCNYVLEFFRQ